MAPALARFLASSASSRNPIKQSRRAAALRLALRPKGVLGRDGDWLGVLKRWLRNLQWRLRGTGHLWLSPSGVRSQTPFDFVPLPGGAIDSLTGGAEQPLAPAA